MVGEEKGLYPKEGGGGPLTEEEGKGGQQASTAATTLTYTVIILAGFLIGEENGIRSCIEENVYSLFQRQYRFLLPKSGIYSSLQFEQFYSLDKD